MHGDQIPGGTTPKHHPSVPVALILIGLIVFFLGINWPIMKTGLESITPVWFAAVRVGAAALVVTTAGLATKRLRVPPRHDLPIVLTVGLGGIALQLGLVFTGLQFIPAGRSSVLLWTAGLWAVPMAAVVLREHMTGRRWVGLAVGIAGIVALFEPWQFDWSDRDILIGHGILLCAALVAGAIIVHTRGHRWASGPATALPWQLGIATIVLLVAAPLVEGAPEIDWSPGFIAIVAYEGIIATGFVSWARQVVALTLSAMTISLIFMGVPLVGLISSVIATGETVTLVGALGILGIGTGVAISVLTAAGEDSPRPR